MNLEAKNSTDENPINLFISIEEPPYSEEVIFIFRKEHLNQATTTIAALPLILEAYYGSRCGNWLTPYAESETIGWSYDKKTGQITYQEDKYTAQILKDWDNDSNDGKDPELGVPVILGNKLSNNQFDDNGTVLTMESELSGWSSSSGEIPMSLG